MDTRPIGIFDSGLGGLTAAAELKQLLPRESIIYFGDTGRMPYGVRPASEIRIIARQNVEFVLKYNVKAIIAACGTISATADDILRQSPVPVQGVLKPGVRELCAINAPTLGVVATDTSVKSGAYEREIEALAPDRSVVCMGCPKFVPLIEAGRFSPEDTELRAAVEEYLAPLKAAGVGALLLGCTHYGLIEEAIRNYLGRDFPIVSAAGAAARAMAAALKEKDQTGEENISRCFTSGSVAEFERLGQIFLGDDINGSVEYIPPFPLKEQR